MKRLAYRALSEALGQIETTTDGSAAQLRLVELLYVQAGGGPIELRGLFGGPVTVRDTTVALIAQDMQRVVSFNRHHSVTTDVCLRAIRFSLQRLIVMLRKIECPGLTNQLSSNACAV